MEEIRVAIGNRDTMSRDMSLNPSIEEKVDVSEASPKGAIREVIRKASRERIAQHRSFCSALLRLLFVPPPLCREFQLLWFLSWSVRVHTYDLAYL